MCSRCEGMVILHPSVLKQIQGLLDRINNSQCHGLPTTIWTELYSTQSLLDMLQPTVNRDLMVEVYD